MTLAFPGQFQGGLTTGYLSIGAVQKAGTGNLGFPGVFQAGLTTGYLNIGAVQKAVSAGTVVKDFIMAGFIPFAR